MPDEEFDFLSLWVTKVHADGNCKYDPEGKRRLIDA